MTCIFRLPLLDPRQKVLGYKLAWQSRPGSALPHLAQLAAPVTKHLAGEDAAFPAGDGLLFLEAPAGSFTPASLRGLAPARTVVSFSAAELAEPAIAAAAGVLRQDGFGLCVRGPAEADLQKLCTHREIDWGEAALSRRLPTAAEAAATQPRVLASGLAHPEEYQASAVLGLHAFAGTHLLASAPAQAGGRMASGSVLILQLMQMVQDNADVRQIETALKRDAALAYQLLRHLNSASFGFGVEVQSLRHAVTMMGYGPLFRWLGVLLARSSAQPASPALLEAAVVRGRFTELLGQGMLPRRDGENLFVTGMFSLLDRLLGVPMAEVLDKVQLPDAVVQALRTRGGMYGPFLQIAEACERPDGGASALADAAFLTIEQVNRAHVAALAWAQGLRA